MHATLSVLLTQAGGHEAVGSGAFEPFFPGLVVPLPLLGFAMNGVLALRPATASSNAVRVGGELELDGPRGRPSTHTLPSFVGPGVLLLSFLITLVNFTRMVGVEL